MMSCAAMSSVLYTALKKKGSSDFSPGMRTFLFFTFHGIIGQRLLNRCAQCTKETTLYCYSIYTFVEAALLYLSQQSSCYMLLKFMDSNKKQGKF